LTFETGCKIRNLGEFAFDGCSSLESIWIPPSIHTISLSCFSRCQPCVRIFLEAGSRLSAQSLRDLRSQYDVTLAKGTRASSRRHYSHAMRKEVPRRQYRAKCEAKLPFAKPSKTLSTK
jgi:hypothetical protein